VHTNTPGRRGHRQGRQERGGGGWRGKRGRRIQKKRGTEIYVSLVGAQTGGFRSAHGYRSLDRMGRTTRTGGVPEIEDWGILDAENLGKDTKPQRVGRRGKEGEHPGGKDDQGRHASGNRRAKAEISGKLQRRGPKKKHLNHWNERKEKAVLAHARKSCHIKTRGRENTCGR